MAPAASITFGLPAPIQTLFLLELAMDKILPEAEDRIRRLLTVLDNIECKMIAGQDYLVATQLDQMYIRADHIEQLEWEYSRWASRLSDELGAPLYPGAAKFTRLFRSVGSGGNIPVKNM